MANLTSVPGARYNQKYDTFAVQVGADVTKGTFATISDATTEPITVATAGAGAAVLGVFEEDVDYSEDGGRTSIVRNGFVPMATGAAITDSTIPVKSDASGLPTPCDTDLDAVGGMPMYTADSGDTVLVDLKLMGSIYGV
jgi:hypothetical protein